ncbi:MAG: 16S rRNA (cytosine(967)-C(5))-methyltransferase RsmB [Firmicutes bacterium]|nr:16S rRNA (cytosine(967)-C(5))-methyltransferase RsmB [Bacillota bacterium]
MNAQQTGPKITAREAALVVLLEVEQGYAYANLALKKMLARYNLNEADNRLTCELVYGTLRMQAAVDYLLSNLLNRPLKKLSIPIHHILRLSLYQLVYLERLPQAAIVHQAVELAKKYGHTGTVSLVNGVLRSFLRQKNTISLPDESDPYAYISITLSYPFWLAEYLLTRWSTQDTFDFCRFFNQYQGIDLRTNTLAILRNDLQIELSKAGIIAQTGIYAPESLLVQEGGNYLPPLLVQGKFIIQGQASQLAAYALNPKPGSKVIDLCAAPGGKTTHMAQLMDNKGEILAVDLHIHRLKLIEENAGRLGITIIGVLAADGRELPSKWHNFADYLLLDAPCSGLGVLGRRADARWRKQLSDIKEMAILSYQLLLAAAAYIKPGGYICYTTCTISEEENCHNIQRFLAKRQDFSLAPMTKLAGLLLNEKDKKAALSGSIQFLPQHQGIEGFYICLLQKAHIYH